MSNPQMIFVNLPVRDLQDWLSRQCEVTDTWEAD